MPPINKSAFLVPLGDRLEKRNLITVLLAVTTVALVAAGFAPDYPVLLIASLVGGATSVVAQILVPFAASLAPDHARGRIVGRVMSGLLTGILLSRTLSSVVCDLAGPAGRLPRLRRPDGRPRAAAARGPAAARADEVHPLPPCAALHGPATVSFVLTGPRFHYSPLAVGVFALVGAAGAAVAPFAGHWADRGLVRPMTGAAFVVAALAFALAGLGGHSVVLIALAAILMDMAVQTTLILGQHTVYHAAGWTGLTVLGAAFPLAALAYWFSERPRRPEAKPGRAGM